MVYNPVKNFNRKIDDFIYPNPGSFERAVLFLDCAMSFVLYGAMPSDYISFEFWKKSFCERRRFLLRNKHKKMIDKYNDKKMRELYFRDKSEFNKAFADFLKRDWLDVEKCSFPEFENFIINKKIIYAKPIKGSLGQGVEVLDLSDKDFDVAGLFDGFKKAEVIIEEQIPFGVLSEFNPSCINSIRIVTLLDGDKTNIIFAALHMAYGNKYVDNLPSGGIAAVVDIDSGIVISRGLNKKHEHFIKHPVSGKQIIGYQIPCWEGIINTVKDASKVVPEVRYVGWDVTLNKDGEPVIIEGNELSGAYVLQEIDQIGKRDLFPV